MTRLVESAFSFIEKLEEQEDLESLTAAFQSLINEFGFKSFAVGDIETPRLHRPGRVWATTWPPEWSERWVSKNYVSVDPVIHQLYEQNVPFRWKMLRPHAKGVGGRVMDEAQEFKIFDGFGVSVRSTNDERVGITMGTEHYEMGPREEATLHLAAIYYQARFDKLRPQPRKKHAIALTAREKECLSWVAAGKSDWEVSQILGISQNTAHEYVQKAMAKLNATSRAHAVAVGLLEGLIHV